MLAMRSAAILVLALTFSNAIAAEVKGKDKGKAGVTPIQKVITLLEEMLSKGTKEKEEEAEKIASFSQWCTDTEKVKTDEITASKEAIEKQTALIQKAAVEIEKLDSRILELEEDVGRWTKDKAAAKDVRGKENADYLATVADYGESVDAIERAIVVLKKAAADKPQTELLQQSLLQLQKSKYVPSAVRGALAAFLQQRQPSELSYEAPEANAYEFQSGSVVDMLEKLALEFKTKKTDIEKEEMMAQHAYEDTIQQLTDNIELAENEISKKKTTKGAKMAFKAETESDKSVTSEDLAEDTKYLTDMTALCKVKTSDFESRQKLRAEELETIQKAIEILSSDAVTGAGEKYLPSLVQRSARVGTALAQLRNVNGDPETRVRLSAFLSDRIKVSGSRLLAQVEQQVAAGDPFTKVKKMIQDLIWKLTEEATSETEDKGWCDKEVSTNTMTREKKSATIDTLKAEIEGLDAKISTLSQEIEDLTGGIASIDAAVASATKTRMESKATNEVTIKEAKEAIAALQQAMAVVKDFYAKSAEATALAQQPEVDAPVTFDKPYKGMLPEGGSVIDFLEVILTDFTRLESETSTAEAQEVNEFKQFMFDSEKDKALKENEKSHKENAKTDAETDLQATSEELKTTQSALEKAQKYYETLKKKCIDSGVTYEDRVKNREAEIESLQEALKILTGVDIA